MLKISVFLRRRLWLFKQVFRPVYLRIYFLLTLFLNVGLFLSAYFIFKNTSGALLILHYNIDFGIDLVGDPKEIFLLPLVGLVVFLLNLILVLSSYRRKAYALLAHFLPLTALLVNIFLLMAMLSLYFINFR
ncbi:MAG: hypothetical protein K9M44_00385 [Candidatus Pacebacteria bacterium]|nr:hypothetical protein [Candidatus Paceibacterota bacterium]